MVFNVRFNRVDSVKQLKKKLKPVLEPSTVYMCIGTDHVVKDSLGPRVGTLLSQYSDKLIVYGVQGDNINGGNVQKAYRAIKCLYPRSTVVVIDAAVGSQRQVGNIQLLDDGIKPGEALDKELGQMGDYSILGIVAKDKDDLYDDGNDYDLDDLFEEFDNDTYGVKDRNKVLNGDSVQYVSAMACTIARAILEATGLMRRSRPLKCKVAVFNALTMSHLA